MTKKSLLNLCVVGIALVMLSSCAGMGQPQTAAQQIASQTDDKVALSQAAYLDALTLFNDLGNRYIKYMPYMEANYPTKHDEILYYFQKMSDMLTMWEGFSQIGVIPEHASGELEAYATAILTIINEMGGI